MDRKHLNLDEREEHNSPRNISTEENTQHSRQIKRNKLKGLNATNRTNNEVDEIWRERMERTESNSPEIPSASPLNGESKCGRGKKGRVKFYITDSAGSAAAQPGHVGGKSLGPPMAIVRLAG